MKNSKELILKCFQEPPDPNKFVQLISEYGKKEDMIDLEHMVSALTVKELEHCWTKLAVLVTESLAILSKIDAHERTNEKAEEVQRNEELIVAVACFASIVIKVVTNLPNRMPAGLLGFADFFNDIVTTLTDNLSLINSILKLCELWWKKDFPNKRKHCFQAFYYMLKKSLKDDAKKSEVKRVWSMHSILTGVSLDEKKNSSETMLKTLLQKASKSSLYLKTDEGVKFISFLFTLSNEEFMKSLHEGIKVELVTGNVFQAKRYSRVYLEAFTAIPRGSRELFEEECLQDLMYLGVHVKSDADVRFSTNLHALLHFIHEQKKTNHDVGVMVYELYLPFLWKCLTVPNYVVRSNAAAILLDLFPLENPAVNIVENDVIFNKQINLFEDILVDPAPLVRQKAVLGVCKILQLYWEVFPTRSTHKYLEILTTKSLVDATSSDVRYAAVVGVQKLLQQRSAIPTLKVVLQKWGCAFNDVNVKVRSAMADLLLKVKYIRFIKYWDIVPIDDIVARLAEDEQFVATKLAKLVFNSYHPQNQRDEVLLDRAITLLKLNSEASKRMYMLSADLLDINNGVKFIIIIIKAVKLQYKRHSKRIPADNACGTPRKDKKLFSQDGSLYQSDNDQQDDEDGEPCSELDKEVMSGLLDIAAILFRLYQKSFREERCSGHLQLLSRACSKTLPKMMAFYKNYSGICTSIICLASFLPSNNMSIIVGFCKSRLRSVTAKSDDYQILLDCLINWRRGDDILEVVTEWLEAGMKVDNHNASRRSSRIGKGVKFLIPTDPRPDMAIIFMTYCISHSYGKIVLLEKNRNDMLALHNNLEAISDLIERRFMCHEPLGDLCTDGFLQDAFFFYLRLTAILNKKDVFDAVEWISNIIDSLDSLLLKVLDNNDGEYNEQDVGLAVNLMNLVLRINSQIVLVGFSNSNFNVKIISLTQKALRSNKRVEFILEASRTLFQVADYAYLNTTPEVMAGPLINLFQDMMKCIAVVKEISEIETLLRQCLQETLALYSSISNQRLLLSICRTFTTVALGCQVKSGLEELCDQTECLMLAAAFRIEPLRICVEQLRELAESDGFENAEELAAALYIISVISKQKKNKLLPHDLASLLRTTMDCKSRLPKQQDKPEATESKILALEEVLSKRFGIHPPSDQLT